MRRVAVLLAAVALATAACAGVVPPAGLTPSPGPSSTPAAPSAVTASPDSTQSAAAGRTPTIAPSTSSASPLPSASPAPARMPSAWTALDAPGPDAREDHTLTVDPDGVAWLFGGRDGGKVLGDLWRFDLGTDTWQEVNADGAAPDPRFGHTANWVDGVGLVVWSGQAGSTFFDDLWAWDPVGGVWRELPADGEEPAARYGSCAALGTDGRLWVSHGFTSDFGRFDDTWSYDFRAGRWTEQTTEGRPIIRCLHDCLFTPDGRFLVYAGQTTGAPAIGDLWARAGDGAWVEAATPDPAARQLYALAARGDAAWIFGGSGDDGSKLGDLWRLDLASLAWEPGALEGGPSPRSGAALVWDEEQDRLVLVGGLTEEGASAETWELAFGG